MSHFSLKTTLGMGKVGLVYSRWTTEPRAERQICPVDEDWSCYGCVGTCVLPKRARDWLLDICSNNNWSIFYHRFSVSEEILKLCLLKYGCWCRVVGHLNCRGRRAKPDCWAYISHRGSQGGESLGLSKGIGDGNVVGVDAPIGPEMNKNYHTHFLRP